VLVLSRKVGEMIQIGDDIVLTVVSVEGNKVRIGIKAPATTPILRGELVVRDAQGARIAVNSGTTRG
jgi:carbon storage regulator